ncbi:MAG: PEP/pyruvate-binding domain-containing protein [Nanoarchaeota archaeon]|nr:PEP/pyruvate-binding domain-containing protein [Nanoarchaeota archaeon]
MLDEKSDSLGVKWLSEITNADESSVGIEGVNIARLYQRKILVPPGFILSKETCENFIKASGIKPRIKAQIMHLDKNNDKQVSAASEKIKEIIEGSDFGGNVIEEIKEAYGFLDTSNIYANNKKLKVSVKSLSSNNNGEANDESSLIKSIVNIYASTIGSSVWVKKCNGDNIEECLPVLAVYKSLNENANAFVYSRNPSNTREMIVEALAGNTISDKYILDRNLEKLSVNKDENRGENKFFDNYSLKRMALYAEEIENIFNCPQKIEFAIGEKGLHILSSAPLYIENNINEEKAGKNEEAPFVLESLDSIVDKEFTINVDIIANEQYEKPETLGKFFKAIEKEERPDVMEKIFGDDNAIALKEKNYEEIALEALG